MVEILLVFMYLVEDKEESMEIQENRGKFISISLQEEDEKVGIFKFCLLETKS